MRTVDAGGVKIGPQAGRLAVIAGPCVVESLELCREIAGVARDLCRRLEFGFIFKASFDKANRTSGHSYRGSGIDRGLEVLATVRQECAVPVLTDIHESWQAPVAAEVVDVLQIPAYLCRQTDLLVAAAHTGRAINVKKGQFLAPWDMAHVAAKVAAEGNENLILTERGVSFGYNTLVVDMTALPCMRALGYPVCFDATHSTQQPGGAGTHSGGRRDMIPYLARAATATGIDALFLEVHPEPERGLSDAATMLRLADLEPLLAQVRDIDAVVRAATVASEG